jgi:hypothetical protein
LKSTASFTFVELCKLYRSTVEFNFVDSTALIYLEDPCKRALRFSQRWWRIQPSGTRRRVSSKKVSEYFDYHEDGCKILFRNFNNCIPIYTVS